MVLWTETRVSWTSPISESTKKPPYPAGMGWLELHAGRSQGGRCRSVFCFSCLQSDVSAEFVAPPPPDWLNQALSAVVSKLHL